MTPDQPTRDAALIDRAERYGDELHRPWHRYAWVAAVLAVLAVLLGAYAVGRWATAPIDSSADDRPAFSVRTAAPMTSGPVHLTPVPLGPDTRLPLVARSLLVHGHSAPVLGAP